MSKLTPDAVRNYRREKRISQKVFARRVGISEASVASFEEGKGNLSDEKAADILEYITRTSKNKSASSGTQEDTSIENMLDDSLMDTIVSLAIKNLIGGLGEATVEEYIQTIRIPGSSIFTEDYSFGEIRQRVTKAENEIKSAIRDRLNEIKRSV